MVPPTTQERQHERRRSLHVAAIKHLPLSPQTKAKRASAVRADFGQPPPPASRVFFAKRAQAHRISVPRKAVPDPTLGLHLGSSTGPRCPLRDRGLCHLLRENGKDPARHALVRVGLGISGRWGRSFRGRDRHHTLRCSQCPSLLARDRKRLRHRASLRRRRLLRHRPRPLRLP